MPQYSAITGSYGDAAYYTGSQDYWQLSGFTEAVHNAWYDLVDVDPLSTALINMNPVFFDALYEPRMAENYYNMKWYDSSSYKLSRHYGRGCLFNTPDTATNTGIKYSDFLNSTTFDKKTMVFVMCGVNGGMSHVFISTTQRSIFKARNALVNMQVESYPFSNDAQGQPAYLRVNINGSVYSPDSDSRIDINDGNPHIVVLVEYLDFNNNSVIELYVDGIRQIIASYNQTVLPTIEDFGFGQWAGDLYPWGSPYPALGLGVSHLAIFDYALPYSVISGLTANLSIPEGGGFYVVAAGRWRRVLL